MRLLIVLALAGQVFALSKSQQIVINHVKAEARKWTKYPTTIAAICFVESSLSKNKNKIGDDGKSYGDLQIQISSTRWIASLYKELEWVKALSDLDIAKLLLTRLDFSVKVASFYFEHYRKHWGYRKAVMMYNGGVKNWRYYNKVEKAKRIIR